MNRTISPSSALAFIASIYMYCLTAQAVTITATGSEYEPAGIRYFFTVDDWNSFSSGESWCINQSPELHNCSLSIHGLRSPGSFSSMVSSVYSWSYMPTTSTTMGQLYNQMNSKGFSTPFKGSILVPKNINPPITNPICISFTRSFTGTNIGGAILPVGPCARVIPPPLKCEIHGNSTIDHGTLTDDKVDGHTASTQLVVECTGISSINISLVDVGSNGIRLRDNGSLYSKISINNKTVDGRGALFSIDNNLLLNVSSQLSKKGELAPGTFSGAAVLRVSPP